jgi:hypothetical protein
MTRYFITHLILASTLIHTAHAANSESPDYEKDILPIIQAHCAKCHGPEKQKSKIRLDTLSTDFIHDRAAAETWHEASNVIQKGEMPPEDEEPLNAEQRKLMTTWIEQNLQAAFESGETSSRGVVMRQLNRIEYQHTMTDLLGFEMDYASELPSDARSTDGFMNNGSALAISALQVENYLKSARSAMQYILLDGEQPERSETELKLASGKPKGKQFIGKASDRLGRANFWHGTFSDLPRSGSFTIRIKARAERRDDQPDPLLFARYGYFVGGLTINIMGDAATIPITSTESAIYEINTRPEFFPLPEAHVPSEKLNGIITMQNVLSDAQPLPKHIQEEVYEVKNGKTRKKKIITYPEDPDFPKAIIESVEFVLNDYPSWPPPLHRRIVPEGEDLASTESVERVLRGFLRRAWRRPPTEKELGTWGAHYQAIRTDCESSVVALRETLAAALASSNFLFLVEPLPGDQGTRPLNAHELASRLSYFLWSSLPDDELAAEADSGALLKPEVLRKQFARMLADEKTDRFAKQFSTQWLDLDGVDRVAINPQYYKSFDNALKPDMVDETRAFFKEILRSNSSALQFLDADFTMLNASLAKHYGMTGPQSQSFERVSLKDSDRPGGLLGHASTHLSGSNGADSHPIKRAVWILERLLHDPPKPPPPDVPDLAESVPDFAKLTVVEQMAAHREKPSCADCHKGIDPWGIALEHFDAVGLSRERTAHGNKAISTETVLPGNHPISGVKDLQTYLLSKRRGQFSEALVAKLLTYALGRSLELEDEVAIKALSEDFAANDYRLASLMEKIVASEVFSVR